jgi:FtsP/CotA-like multicopper oxidase with cupredoxin domain
MDYQATDNWRLTGRVMKTQENIVQAYGTTWAGNGSDQLPTPTLFVHPGSNYMLSATGVLNNSTSVELSWGRAANSLNFQLQQQPVHDHARGPGRAIQRDHEPSRCGD